MEHSLYDVDKEARFQKVYDAYMQDVYRLCFSYMKNKMDTEDAVQETFCRFYQAMERVKEEEHVKGVASCHSRKCLQKYFEALVAEKSKLAGK